MTRSTVALLLCSLGSLIACDGEPTTVAQAEVSGTISYRERIELPRGATVRIVAEDVSRADAPATILAEDIFATNGRLGPDGLRTRPRDRVSPRFSRPVLPRGVGWNRLSRR